MSPHILNDFLPITRHLVEKFEKTLPYSYIIALPFLPAHRPCPRVGEVLTG